MFFELGDDLVGAVLGVYFVGHVLLDPVEPDEVEAIVSVVVLHMIIII